MAGRWRWLPRQRRGADDLPRRARPDDDVPSQRPWWAGADGVPGVVETSRCDGAVVYVQPAERRAALARNQRTDRYLAPPPDQRNRRRS